MCRRVKGMENAQKIMFLISEGMYYLKLFIKVLEVEMNANVLFLVREVIMYLSKYFQS